MNKSNVCYQVIFEYYKGKIASNGVPYINHINEGLIILDHIATVGYAKQAYCIHPLLQSDEALVESMDLEDMHNSVFSKYIIDQAVVVLAMEYRAVANAYLSFHDSKKPKLSPLKIVNDMLIADKVQNRKDFELYHEGRRENSERLKIYFREWLDELGITEERYQELTKLIT